MRDQTGNSPEELASAPWQIAVRECPVRELFAHLGDKWSMLVLLALAQHPTRKLRFSELTARVAGISQRMLAATLRYLERDGIVLRRLYPEVPPRVEYTLSDRGNRLLASVEKLVVSVQSQWPEIRSAREEYDKRYKKNEG